MKQNKRRVFEFVIQETNGEHEYHHDHVIYAKSEREAWKLARNYTRDFYGEGSKHSEDAWEFFGGCIVCEIYTLVETTDAAIAKKAFGCGKVINPHGMKVGSDILYELEAENRELKQQIAEYDAAAKLLAKIRKEN